MTRRLRRQESPALVMRPRRALPPSRHPLRRGDLPAKREFQACKAARSVLDRLVAHPQQSGQGSVLPLLAMQVVYQLFHQRRLFAMRRGEHRQYGRDYGAYLHRRRSAQLIGEKNRGLR